METTLPASFYIFCGYFFLHVKFKRRIFHLPILMLMRIENPLFELICIRHCAVGYAATIETVLRGNPLLRGGGGVYSTNIYTGRLHPEVQPLNFLYTIFHEKGTPFVYLLLTNGTPFIYLV